MWAVMASNHEVTIGEVETPVPQKGQILIEVQAAGVNRADLLQVQGHYPPPPGAAEILGLEAAGTVVSLGEGVDREWLGRGVVTLVPGGAQAQYCLSYPQLCLPLPQLRRKDTMLVAAALLEAAVTSWYNLVTLNPLIYWKKSGSRLGATRADRVEPRLPQDTTVLIQGGSGGVGTFAIQLARLLGARVGATAGNQNRCDKLKLLGAQGSADYSQEDDLQRLRQELTGSTGFNLILDVSGAGGLSRNLGLLSQGGRLHIIGLQKGSKAEIDLAALLARGQCLQGSTLRGLDLESKHQLLRQIQDQVWPEVEAGQIHPVIAQTYPFSQVAQAHAVLGARTERPFGKIVLLS